MYFVEIPEEFISQRVQGERTWVRIEVPPTTEGAQEYVKTIADAMTKKHTLFRVVDKHGVRKYQFWPGHFRSGGGQSMSYEFEVPNDQLKPDYDYDTFL